MPVTVKCLHCEEDLEFDVSGDTQGEGCWAMYVETVSLEKQNCQCEFSPDDLAELEEKASMISAEQEPYFSMIY